MYYKQNICGLTIHLVSFVTFKNPKNKAMDSWIHGFRIVRLDYSCVV